MTDNSTTFDNQTKASLATRVVNMKLGLYIHLLVYVAVNALLVVINLLTSDNYLWFWWPLIGWGLGILLHVLAVLAFARGGPIRQRMIEREMRR